MELAFLNGDFSPSNQYNSIQEYINQIGCSSFISSNVHKFKLAWGKRNDGGLHPDAWHQKPSINDVCRLHEAQWSEDIEDVRISQSGLPLLSGPRRAQWLPPPAGRGQYSYGYPRKLMRKILGSILDSSDFFALSYFCTLQNVYEIWGVWQRPPVKISGNMLDIIKKAEIFWRMFTHESRIMADTSISTQTTPTTTPAQSTHSHTDTSGSSPMTSPWVNQMSICHKDNSDHNPPH